MKYDVYFIEVGFHLSYLDAKFKGKTKCVPNVGDYVDYELFYKGGCVVICDKVVERVHYLQDDKVELRVSITGEEALEDLRDCVRALKGNDYQFGEMNYNQIKKEENNEQRY